MLVDYLTDNLPHEQLAQHVTACNKYVRQPRTYRLPCDRRRCNVRTVIFVTLPVLLLACNANIDEQTTGDVATASSGIEHYLAIEEIKKLKARYFRYLDTKNWAEIETLFTPDAQAVYNVVNQSGLGTLNEPIIGPSEIAAFIQRGVEPLVTVHHGHMPEIEVISPTTARGIWAMEDILQRPEDSVNVVHGFGHYHETYERIAGEWLIKTLQLSRLRVDRQ